MTHEGSQTSKERVGLAAIRERFPGHGLVFQRLFRESDHFQSLCGDFVDGLNALKRWERSAAEEAAAMCSMYKVLLQELEQEVMEFLKHETAAGCPS